MPGNYEYIPIIRTSLRVFSGRMSGDASEVRRTSGPTSALHESVPLSLLLLCHQDPSLEFPDHFLSVLGPMDIPTTLGKEKHTELLSFDEPSGNCLHVFANTTLW